MTATARPLILRAAVTTLGLFAAMQALALWRVGGHLYYPVDDVYIHLSIGEQIAAGGYGINAGEPAAAASSALYPFLLAPFGGTALQPWLPLFWNAVALVAAAVLWGRIVAEAGWRGRAAGVIALVGPLAMNFALVAFSGMETALQGAASLALLLGLMRFLQSGRVGALLVVAVLLGPLLRYESLGPAGVAALIVLARGRPGAGLGLLALTVLPLVLFGLWLMSMGLAPLPNSILAKGGLDAPGPLAWLGGNIVENLSSLPGLVILLLGAICAWIARASTGWARWVALAGLAEVVGHTLMGEVGWFDRYEHYALCFAGGAAVAAAAPLVGRPAGALALRGLALAAIALTALYQSHYAQRGQWAPNALHLQQVQMARFAQDVLAAPVAVNDIGRVSWRNTHYVLDLYGLASAAALEARLTGPRGWAAPLAAEHDIVLAMIYDTWIAGAPGPEWERLGVLGIDAPAGGLGGLEVAFYAIDPADAPRITALLRDFTPTLPPGAVFRFEGQDG